MGLLIIAVKGQPPHMIAAQNVMTTDTMAHMTSMGVGGLIPPPIIAWLSAATIAPTTSVVAVRRRPFIGCGCVAANAGLLPHITATMICIGITQRRKYESHPVKKASVKSEMKPNATAMTRAVATTPTQGCLRPDMCISSSSRVWRQPSASNAYEAQTLSRTQGRGVDKGDNRLALHSVTS